MLVQLLLGLYALFMLILCVSGLIFGALALLLKNQQKKVATDVFLVVSTLVVVAGYGFSLLPKEAYLQNEYSREKLIVNSTRHANLLAYGLAQAEFNDRLSEPWHMLNYLDGVIPTQAALSDAADLLNEQLRTSPDEPHLLADLTVVLHRQGRGDDLKLLHRYADRDIPLLNALSSAYRASAGGRETVGTEMIEVLEKELPANWYRRKALATAYQHGHPQKLKELLAAEEARFQKWRSDVQIYHVVRGLICAAGVVSLLCLIFRHRRLHRTLAPATPADTLDSMQTDTRPPIRSFSFRLVYVCVLSMFYAASTIVFLFGIVAGVLVLMAKGSGIGSTRLQDYTLTGQIIEIAGSAIGVFSITYFLICRPIKISLWRFFLGESKLTWWQVLRNGVMWFSFVALFKTLVEWIYTLMPFLPHGGGKDIDFQIIDAAVTAQGWLVAWFLIVVCLFAPVVEELLFRGLLYPWMRNRWNIPIGIVVSSAVFAAAHMDPLNFFSYLVMGIILATAYECTRSLPVCATVHCISNGLFVLIVSIVPS